MPGLPSVSVVIPCYNYGRYLEGCVRSVLDQEGVEARVLIIDDTSTDDSWAVASAIAAREPRVEAWHHEVNRGHIATYNEGLLGWADGEYVALLSADDLLTPGSLARSVAVMTRHPRVGMVYGRAVEFSDADEPRTDGEDLGAEVWDGTRWLALRCREAHNVVPNPGVVLRTSIQRQVGGYDPVLPHAGDFEMWLRVAAVADVAYVRGIPQACYRVHPRSMSQGVYQDPLADLRQRVLVLEKLFAEHGDELAGRGIDPDVTRRELASEALWIACRAYEKGTAGDHPVDEWVAEARTIWPAADALPAARALRRRRRLAGVLSRRVRLFAPTALVHRVRDRLWWRRWRRHGG